MKVTISTLHSWALVVGVLAVAIPASVGMRASKAQVFADRSPAQAAKEFRPEEPRFSGLSPLQLEEAAEFILGSTLFTVSHELGHAIIGLYQLPMLGPEEDAADTFAAIALLSIGSEFTHRAMLDAAISLKLAAEREARTGHKPTFFQQHRPNQQRAYSIVCLMFGSNPRKFKDLAELAKLPEERQETCTYEFEQADAAWNRVLTPHMRGASSAARSLLGRLLGTNSADTSRELVEIRYLDAPPHLAPYRALLVRAGMLEAVRNKLLLPFALPTKIIMEAKVCSEPNAYWDSEMATLTLCYELLMDFAELALPS
jgi:Putative metallopeptidase